MSIENAAYNVVWCPTCNTAHPAGQHLYMTGDYVCGNCGQTHGLGIQCPLLAPQVDPRAVPISPLEVQPATMPAMGWQCPGCKRCYSPSWPQCSYCGPTTVGTTTLGTGP